MELALTLIIVVMAEIALSFYLLARIRDYKKRVQRLEKNVVRLASELKSGVDAGEEDNALANDVLVAASPEDIEQAKQILEALGLQTKE